MSGRTLLNGTAVVGTNPGENVSTGVDECIGLRAEISIQSYVAGENDGN
jgi:hypothetical protein